MKLRTLSRLSFMAALLAGVFCLSGAPLRADTSDPELSAKPLTVIVPDDKTEGTTQLYWFAGIAYKTAQLWLQVDAEAETLFADKSSGRQDATIVLGKTYTFNLRAADKKLLKSVVVTASHARPRQPRRDRREDRSPGDAPSTSINFSGVWNTVTADTKYSMTLRQRGEKVTGHYSPLDGVIEGEVKDNVLRFKWTQNGGTKGAGRFTLAADGKSFEGTWSATENPDDASGGTWNGTRAGR
jgi:hypothetical protein